MEHKIEKGLLWGVTSRVYEKTFWCYFWNKFDLMYWIVIKSKYLPLASHHSSYSWRHQVDHQMNNRHSDSNFNCIRFICSRWHNLNHNHRSDTSPEVILILIDWFHGYFVILALETEIPNLCFSCLPSGLQQFPSCHWRIPHPLQTTYSRPRICHVSSRNNAG